MSLLGQMARSRRTVLIALPTVAILAIAYPAAAAGSGSSVSVSKASRPQALTAAQVKQLAANADKRVIVIMRNQAAGFNPGLAHIDARNAVTAGAEQSVFSELRQLHAPNLHAYHLISAVSATVSAAER